MNDLKNFLDKINSNISLALINNLLYFIAFSLSHWIILYLISLSPDYQSSTFSLFQSFEKSPPVWLDLLVKQGFLEKPSWLPVGAPAQLLGSRFPGWWDTSYLDDSIILDILLNINIFSISPPLPVIDWSVMFESFHEDCYENYLVWCLNPSMRIAGSNLSFSLPVRMSSFLGKPVPSSQAVS